MFYCLFFLLAVNEMPPSTNRCINNNDARVLNGNQLTSKGGTLNTVPVLQSQQQQQEEHSSNVIILPTPEDGSVLKKIVSFTVEQKNTAEHSASKATCPTFVPEKLNFSAYERFEGTFYRR